MSISPETMSGPIELSLNNSVVGTSVPPTAFFGKTLKKVNNKVSSTNISNKTLQGAPTGIGTHHAIMNSYKYLSQGLRQYNLDNKLDGFYIAPAFMDKLVVHITKNFLTLPNIKVCQRDVC
ncbi:hypothetical protein KY290_038175 [Solanum tuberosum]|uniref:Uncharacterized protein n=1 Tax=Solanum tuberosum TaxID=4113 RepID=A0ABQ7TYB0_SOLTU|nr:hypothetical protein KY290_038175 [Solanum tuberosum]